MANGVEQLASVMSSADPDKPSNTNTHPSHQDDTKKKVMTFRLYDPKVSASLLLGLTLSPCQLNTEIDDIIEAVDENPIGRPETEVHVISSKMTCTLCSCNFTSRHEQTDHYKLDWHRFNLKQRMMGAPAVKEEHFENISGDVSSISGSDSSTDDDSDKDSDLSPYSNSGFRTADSSNQSVRRIQPGYHVKGRRHHKVFFRNIQGQLVSVQRSILHGKKNAPTTQQELVTIATQLPTRMKWVILMIGGGHFAGAIFNGKEIAAHKTFHRYTVRAKRGTAQGMRDSQQGGNQPKSAGASLRRYNEAALVEDIHALLASWNDQINACHRIFIRAPSYNKNAFFGGKTPPLDRRDERIITIPYATRRPTHKEVQRVHALLSTIECHGDAIEAEKRIMEAHSPESNQQTDEEITSKDDKKMMTENQQSLLTSKDGKTSKENRTEGALSVGNVASSEDDLEFVLVEEEITTLELQEFETSVKKPKRPKKKRKPKILENNDELGKPNSMEVALCKACRDGDWDQLKLVALSNRDDMTLDTCVEDLATVVNRPVDGHGNTLLHVAVQAEQMTILWNLMETDANPAIKNKKGQLPYVLCNNKEMRKEFRRFMAAHPEKFDYNKAQIPSPLTSDKEEIRAVKAAEKRRMQKKNKRIKEKEQKEDQKRQDEERRKQEAEEDEKQRFASLSDREKRALAAERRFQAQLAEQDTMATLSNSRRCWLCGTSLVGKVPFEYLDYKFCTIQCVKQHKQQQKTSTT